MDFRDNGKTDAGPLTFPPDRPVQENPRETPFSYKNLFMLPGFISTNSHK